MSSMLFPIETQSILTLDDVTDDVSDYVIDFDVSDDVIYSQSYCYSVRYCSSECITPPSKRHRANSLA